MFAVLSDAVPGDLDVDDVTRSSVISICCLTKGADAGDQKGAE